MQKENSFFFSFSNESTFDRRSKAPFHDTQSLCRAAIFYHSSEYLLSLIRIGLYRGWAVFAQGVNAVLTGNRSRSHDRLRLRKSSCAPTQTIIRVSANSASAFFAVRAKEPETRNETDTLNVVFHGF